MCVIGCVGVCVYDFLSMCLMNILLINLRYVLLASSHLKKFCRNKLILILILLILIYVIHNFYFKKMYCFVEIIDYKHRISTDYILEINQRLFNRWLTITMYLKVQIIKSFLKYAVFF